MAKNDYILQGSAGFSGQLDTTKNAARQAAS